VFKHRCPHLKRLSLSQKGQPDESNLNHFTSGVTSREFWRFVNRAPLVELSLETHWDFAGMLLNNLGGQDTWKPSLETIELSMLQSYPNLDIKEISKRLTKLDVSRVEGELVLDLPLPDCLRYLVMKIESEETARYLVAIMAAKLDNPINLELMCKHQTSLEVLFQGLTRVENVESLIINYLPHGTKIALTPHEIYFNLRWELCDYTPSIAYRVMESVSSLRNLTLQTCEGRLWTTLLDCLPFCDHPLILETLKLEDTVETEHTLDAILLLHQSVSCEHLRDLEINVKGVTAPEIQTLIDQFMSKTKRISSF